MKRAIIVHGWSGNPEEAWFPWLKRQLEGKGYSVEVPAMPDTDHPTITAWVSKLAEVIGTPDSELVLIGHSIGCQTVLRYLATITTSIGGMVLVAPWLRLHNLEGPAEEAIAEPWLHTPIDWNMVRHNYARTTLLFSDDDPYVPMLNKDLFAAELASAKITILHGLGHVNDDMNVKMLPEALAAIP